MSLPQNGRDTERPTTAGGSVRAARERAEAGLGRSMNQSPEGPRRGRGLGGPTAGQSKPSKPQLLGGKPGAGQTGVTISRPTQIPQWPLPGPISSSVSSDANAYQPPPGRSQPPQRPPRPSRVPSILDNSKIQDHTPVFQYQPRNARDSDQDYGSSVPPTPSVRQTVSSVGSIPDFPEPVSVAVPVPVQAPPPVRRSVNLGPPPSARRGASSFYSNVSFVSPIPEESPRSRSHTSLASSAAMPESFGSASPALLSPNYLDPFYDDALTEEGRESVYEDEGDDESKLVRSASIGKRGKPHLVMNRGASNAGESSRPGPKPVQAGLDPFANGTGFLEASFSSEDATASTKSRAVLVGEASDPARDTPSPSARTYSRLSAIRRPPRLDMDSVDKMNSRGSMTSLPDLIRRATRLAAMIDRGKRPASRFDDLEYPDEKLAARESEGYSSKLKPGLDRGKGGHHSSCTC